MTGDQEYFLFKSTQDSPKTSKKLDQATLVSHVLSSGPRYLLWSKWLGFLLIFKINCIWMRLLMALEWHGGQSLILRAILHSWLHSGILDMLFQTTALAHQIVLSSPFPKAVALHIS